MAPTNKPNQPKEPIKKAKQKKFNLVEGFDLAKLISKRMKETRFHYEQITYTGGLEVKYSNKKTKTTINLKFYYDDATDSFSGLGFHDGHMVNVLLERKGKKINQKVFVTNMKIQTGIGTKKNETSVTGLEKSMSATALDTPGYEFYFLDCTFFDPTDQIHYPPLK